MTADPNDTAPKTCIGSVCPGAPSVEQVVVTGQSNMPPQQQTVNNNFGFAGLGQGGGAASGDETTVAEVMVIGRRPRNGHSYQTPRILVCMNVSAVTSSQLANALSRFAVPGVPHSMRQANGLNFASWGMAPGGFVTTQFSHNGLSVTNTTTSIHVFGGSITTSYSFSGGHVFVQTTGSGTTDPVRDSINQTTSPEIFGRLDRDLANYIRDNVSEC